MLDWESIESLLRAQQTVSVRVRGTSMYPAIFADDVLTIAPLREHPRPGSVVLVRANGRYLIHRLVTLNQTEIMTKGDNLDAQDPLADVLLGVVVEQRRTLKSRLKRFAYRFLKSRNSV